MFADRFIRTAMVCLCNDDYIPHTCSDNADAVNIRVVTPMPLNFSTIIQCCSIGMLQIEDEAGLNVISVFYIGAVNYFGVME